MSLPRQYSGNAMSLRRLHTADRSAIELGGLNHRENAPRQPRTGKDPFVDVDHARALARCRGVDLARHAQRSPRHGCKWRAESLLGQDAAVLLCSRGVGQHPSPFCGHALQPLIGRAPSCNAQPPAGQGRGFRRRWWLITVVASSWRTPCYPCLGSAPIQACCNDRTHSQFLREV